MPKILPDRWQPESIREFRASALERYNDGLASAAAGRRTGAIYLWGYCAEMLLKAAYFPLAGIAEDAPLSWQQHILPAMNRGRNSFQIHWPYPGQGHNVRAWAELLVAERAVAGAAYPPSFGTDVQRSGQQTGSLWSETLRYHKNTAYAYEVTKVRRAAEWFLVNFDLF